MGAPDRSIEVIHLEGQVPYQEAYCNQIERRKAVEAGEAGNALFILEHTPVFTLGRNAHAEHILAGKDLLDSQGIEVCEADRGGDVTYHGPGQVVVYPILDLNHWKCSIQWYLRSLETILIEVLSGYGLKGERIEGYTGVWVDGAKVANIGIGLHNWVTFHGIALNVNPNMDHFKLIVPCGIPDKPVTSLGVLLNEPHSIEIVKKGLEKNFIDYFSRPVE